MPDSTRDNAYQRQLARALEELGVDVALADPAGTLPLLRAVRAHAPVHVLHLHWTHHLVLGSTRLRSLIKGTRFLCELAVLRLRGVRVVWTAHNIVNHERQNPAIELFFGRIAMRLYTRVIVHCAAAREAVAAAYHLSRRRHARMEVIPHGHFIDSYPDTVEQDAARARLGLEAGAPVFVHFGQIRPYKGVFELLDAFDAMASPSAELVVAGKPWNDRMATTLQARARRNPRIRLFLGFVPDDEVQLYMKAADAVVLPYRDILTSGSAMLAMSFGRAVIMPRCGCAEEMLNGSRGALLYEASDKQGLAAALRTALDADLKTMGARNRLRAAGFDWRQIAVQTTAAYGEGAPDAGR